MTFLDKIIPVLEISHKLPRKKKKKLFGTRKNPRVFYGLDLARNGAEVNIYQRIFVEDGNHIQVITI